MPSGTPGFVGERLTEAREARGLTAVALADLLGVSRAAVSQYENGQVTPRPEVMFRITRVLNLPPQFFSRPIRQREPIPVFYRSMSAATKTARTRAEWRMEWLCEEIVPYLCSLVDFPEVEFPAVTIDDPSTLTTDEIETAAAEVRRFWGLKDGPISNIVWLLENNGAVVTREEFGTEKLDSFSSWKEDGRPYVFLSADKHSAVRSRFDAAHEIGHLVLHRGFAASRLRNPADHRLAEDQANRFASAFLLPEQSFSRDIDYPTLDRLRALKTKWLVSIGAMLKRAEDLGFVSDSEARHLWILYVRRGWKRREPLDDDLEIEKPRLKSQAFELLLNQRVQSIDDVLAYIPYPPSDIEELAMLPRGYLSPKPPTVQLKAAAKGRLIQFPSTQRHSN